MAWRFLISWAGLLCILNRDAVDRALVEEEDGAVAPLAVGVAGVCSLDTLSSPLLLSLSDNGSAVVAVVAEVGLLLSGIISVVVVAGDNVLLGTCGESICAKAFLGSLFLSMNAMCVGFDESMFFFALFFLSFFLDVLMKSGLLLLYLVRTRSD